MCNEYLSLEEVKEVEFTILQKFIAYCEEHNLLYTLTYGTLLGAIRHKGFIPWDDDVDVMMPRADYEKFVQAFAIASPIEGCELMVHTKENNYYFPFAKLCDKNTVAKMEDNHTEHGIWVDVFPVDHVPDDEEAARKFHRHIRFYKDMIISYTTDFSTKHGNWKLIPKFFLSGVAHVVGVRRFLKHIEKETVKYNKKGTKKVAVVSWQSNESGNMLENDFINPILIEFNGIKANSPANFDSYLKGIYGNYMQLPPENKRTTHHVIAYYKIMR